ncbi:flagellar hook protein FlgE [Salidesulfovibrio onnuriiensis]|uniref:flagellar hook protein FlgE n=1 Tax=Salidesulfovibrio onnuriiensis TaxID=2583823 RepID=UPI0011CC7FBA|nr:flagellar hook-basal body complex protein [Salidesulfovibrio onnuriiensis]
MGLSASLYSGITGLTAHGEKMTVIGNNLANVNTTGFKAARMHFEDFVSQDFPTTAGTSQVGRGVRVAAIYADFGQGALETTTESTDMAISGDGFFTVSPKGEDANYYTRAGVFRFDNDGFLVDPHGYVVQGWAVEQQEATVATSTTADQTTTSTGARIIGTPTDIQLENFQSPPKATSQVSMVTNLDPTTVSRSNDTNNPYFALMQNWDGSAETPLASGNYAYSSTIKVFDEVGASHNLTVYFDQVTMSNAGGDTVWEYMVTIDPLEDKRIISGADGNMTAMAGTSAAGLLMCGTMTFRTGQLVGMNAFTLQSNGGINGGSMSLDSWQMADFSSQGYPVFAANFLGQSNASTTNSANASLVELNFGLRNTDLTSNGSGAWTAGWAQTTGALQQTAADVSNNISNSGILPNFKGTEISALATQSFDTGGSSTLFQNQNGYSAGVLQGVSVSRDGILSGRYSNGQTLQLYSLTLATFTDKWHLRREGGNLFSETTESGPALTGQAGDSGKGVVDGNSLEISNVDMGNEFVKMITTQRGFQANTKVITSADSMLGEVIAMKR